MHASIRNFSSGSTMHLQSYFSRFALKHLILLRLMQNELLQMEERYDKLCLCNATL